MEITGLRDEYDRVGVGPVLQGLLARIVLSTVQMYPPAEYSPDGTWDHAACEDVLNDWVLERLLQRGDLAVMLGSARTTAQFRAACTTSLRQFLVNRRRRTIASNLYKRIRDMLSADGTFIAVSTSSNIHDTRWTLADSPITAQSPLARGELLRIANGLTDEQLQIVRYGPFSHKLSPILRKPHLQAFLTHLLKNSRGPLSLATILDVVRFRFMLVEVSEESLADNLSIETTELESISNGLAAESIAMRLNRDEAQIIREYFRDDVNATRTGTRTGIPDNTNDVVRRVFGMIAELADTEDDARSIANRLDALLAEGAE